MGAQNLWVLMVCRSFFTPGRDIGSAVFMMWVLVQSGMLSCDSSFGQYLKQYVMKEAVIYKILRYRQNRIDLTPMRSDGPITADTKQKSNIPNCVSPYSPWNLKTTSPTAQKPTPYKQHCQYIYQV
jgi:hypothetical protein